MTVSTFACLEKAVECSLFSTLFDFLSNLSLPILQSDNLTIWQSANLTILQSDNLAIWQLCRHWRTAIIWSITPPLLHIIATGQTALESSGQKVLKAEVLRKSVSGNKKHSTSRFFPNNCPRKGNWGTISKPHLCRCRTFDNHQRWQTHNVEKSLSKIEKPSWANKRQFWKHLNDDCSRGIIVLCKSCPYHGVEIVRTLQCGSSFNQISTQFSSFLSCVHQLRLSANHATHTVKTSDTSDPSSAPSYHAYTTAATYNHGTRTRALSRQVIPVILFYISDNQ